MKMIYNEGRVVGLSMYEIYVRQLMSLNPEATPMSEREWLTSTLANNSSMILRIPAGTSRGIHDFILPSGSNLTACTQIFASMFQGEVSLDDSKYWATKVEDYGDAISNTQELHPVTPGTPPYVPSKEDPEQESQTIINRTHDFLKIKEALVIQPGEWNDVIYADDSSDDDNSDSTSDEFIGSNTTSDSIDSSSNESDSSSDSSDTDSDTSDEDNDLTVTWDTPIEIETEYDLKPSDRVVTTEYGEWLIGERTGTVQEMEEDLAQYEDDPEPPPGPRPEPDPPVPPKPIKADKFLEPDFKQRAFIRILLSKGTAEDLYILLHGFVDKVLLTGEVSYPYQGSTLRPEDGDFLGPAQFPWSCPVILTISTDMASVIIKEQEEINKDLEERLHLVHNRELYLGTFHSATWEAELADQELDANIITTEDDDVIIVAKSGLVSEMWQDGYEGEISYYVPWLDPYELDLTTEDGQPIIVPKQGTIEEMIEEGGIF